jgi:hypothetical protein
MPSSVQGVLETVSCSGITLTPAQTEIEGQHRESFSDEFTSSP